MFERHDKVLHEFDNSHQRLILRREEVDRKLGAVVVVQGYDALVPACYGTQEGGTDEQKSLRDLGLARLFANWLLGAPTGFEDVARGQ